MRVHMLREGGGDYMAESHVLARGPIRLAPSFIFRGEGGEVLLVTQPAATPFYSRLMEQIFKDDINGFSSISDI